MATQSVVVSHRNATREEAIREATRLLETDGYRGIEFVSAENAEADVDEGPWTLVFRVADPPPTVEEIIRSHADRT